MSACQHHCFSAIECIKCLVKHSKPKPGLQLFDYKFSSNVFIQGRGKEEIEVIKQAHEFTGNIIATKRAKFQMEGSRRKMVDEENEDESNYYGKKQRFAMLDTLLLAEREQQIDAKGINDEVNTFVFEGFDTTMTAITFTLFMLAHHQEIQQRLFVTLAAQDNDHVYLDAVIKETLRLYPPVPFIGSFIFSFKLSF